MNKFELLELINNKYSFKLELTNSSMSDFGWDIYIDDSHFAQYTIAIYENYCQVYLIHHNVTFDSKYLDWDYDDIDSDGEEICHKCYSSFDISFENLELAILFIINLIK